MPTRKGFTNNPHGRPPLPADERRTTTSIQMNAITRRKLDELAAGAQLTRSLMIERLVAEAHARAHPEASPPAAS
jgi:hypothetical protein